MSYIVPCSAIDVVGTGECGEGDKLLGISARQIEATAAKDERGGAGGWFMASDESATTKWSAVVVGW